MVSCWGKWDDLDHWLSFHFEPSLRFVNVVSAASPITSTIPARTILLEWKMFRTAALILNRKPSFQFCFSSLWWISGPEWVRSLSFKITVPFSLLGSISVNLWRASCGLSRNLPGSSFSPCFIVASLLCYAMLSHFSHVRLCVTPRRQPTRLPCP